MLRPQAPRTERLFDLDLGWLEIVPGWWWLTAVLGAILGIVVALVSGVL